MESLNEFWSLVKEEIKRNVAEVIFDVWFGDLELTAYDGITATLSTAKFKRDILEQHFKEVIAEAFQKVSGLPVTLEFVNAGAETFREVKPDVIDVDEENTFETFVVGPSNRFAYAAAQAVAANPGKAYNPLVIYGASGLGKTHLLSAINHEIKAANPSAKVIYTRTEDFINMVVEGIRTNRMSEVHNKYRSADALLMDDIQFIAGKDSTMEEFFHTFNTLQESGCQIVLTSDRLPKEIPQLEERLRSRFEGGLLADIQPPEIETRIAIINRKASSIGLDISSDVAQYMAEHIKSNVRQLEGAVKKMNALVSIEKTPANIATAQHAIRDILNDSRPVSATVDNIIQEVARTHGGTADDIRSKKRDAQTTRMRQIAIYIVREVTDLSLVEIGKQFGKDHSTVIYSLNTIESEISTNSSLRTMVANIIKNIQEQ